MRFMTLALGLLLPGLAHAQATAVSPFVGDYTEGFESAPSGFSACHTVSTVGNACDINGGTALLASSGWSFTCSISPWAGTRFMGSSGPEVEITFNVPIQQFGGYFGTNCGTGETVTLWFYDAAGALIDSTTDPLANCGWDWRGYALPVPATRVVVENSYGSGGFVMMDDLQVTEQPQSDLDQDGFDVASGDCNDNNATVYPGAPELCDGLDNDCDGALSPIEIDNDGDGSVSCIDCDDSDPALNDNDADFDGWSTCDGDCDDADSFLSPEDGDGDGWSTCNGDCNDFDANLDPSDVDGDSISSCAGDCDDNDASISPLIDGDGDGDHACFDCDDNDPTRSSVDADGDGFASCDPIPDCDDTDPNVRPGATELCDGVDTDCDGVVLDAEADLDGDGVPVCEGDCDDEDGDRAPGLTEICDGKDNDCDGSVSADELDSDGDGYAICDDDCDDGDADSYPGAPDIAGDGIDQDCDGADQVADGGQTQPVEVKPGGCSCDSAPAPVGWLALLPLALVLRRR